MEASHKTHRPHIKVGKDEEEEEEECLCVCLRACACERVCVCVHAEQVNKLLGVNHWQVFFTYFTCELSCYLPVSF